jgi:hypothetical protein
VESCHSDVTLQPLVIVNLLHLNLNQRLRVHSNPHAANDTQCKIDFISQLYQATSISKLGTTGAFFDLAQVLYIGLYRGKH